MQEAGSDPTQSRDCDSGGCTWLAFKQGWIQIAFAAAQRRQWPGIPSVVGPGPGNRPGGQRWRAEFRTYKRSRNGMSSATMINLPVKTWANQTGNSLHIAVASRIIQVFNDGESKAVEEVKMNTDRMN